MSSPPSSRSGPIAKKVDVKVDYITSQGNKLLPDAWRSKAQARSGHDIMEFTNWESAQYNSGARAGRRRRQERRRRRTARSIPRSNISAGIEGKWLGVPMTRGTLLLGSLLAFRPG